jgi:hypothetical protein
MSTATATPAINLNALGIQDMAHAISKGQATVYDVMLCIRKRIEKRIANKQNLLAPVVRYHNELAESYENATGDMQPRFSVPVYSAPAQPNTALPTDP